MALLVIQFLTIVIGEIVGYANLTGSTGFPLGGRLVDTHQMAAKQV